MKRCEQCQSLFILSTDLGRVNFCTNCGKGTNAGNSPKTTTEEQRRKLRVNVRRGNLLLGTATLVSIATVGLVVVGIVPPIFSMYAVLGLILAKSGLNFIFTFLLRCPACYGLGPFFNNPIRLQWVPRYCQFCGGQLRD